MPLVSTQISMKLHHAIFQRRQIRPGFRASLGVPREPATTAMLKPGTHKLRAGLQPERRRDADYC
jgi:hypothetical protein